MKRQSNKKMSRDITAAIYPRLSRDDGMDGDSNSIATQKKLLTKAAKDRGYTNILTFVDDGVSGVTMNRPGFNDMMAELEKGYIGAVFVKDLSRLGRNYLEVGKLMEEFFPDNDIRLVAVSDNVDTAEGQDDMTIFRNVFNEWYSRDISRKMRASNRIKGTSGEPIGLPPYGYMKDPDSKYWIVDDEAAEVVKRIFEMTLNGIGTEQIAAALTEDRILNPTHYWQSKGMGRGGKKAAKEPHYWNCSTVANILVKQQYCGDVINFKTYSKSHKNKKRIDNAPEDWVVFKDVHEPLVDRAAWEQIMEKRKRKTRKRLHSEGEKNIFSGLLVCADCGQNLWFHFNQNNHDVKFFNCSNYKGNRGTCQTTHHIRADFLEDVVSQEIRRLIKFAKQDEQELAKVIMGQAEQSNAENRKRKQNELYKLNARNREIDKVFNRLYEDNINGKIDDNRFASMSKQYTEEQNEVKGKIKALSDELDKEDSKAMTADMFISTVRKYTKAKKLTERMPNELIERIEVYDKVKVDGEHRQSIIIHYACGGEIAIPEEVSPWPEVTIKLRQGVIVAYDWRELAQRLEKLQTRVGMTA